MLGLNFLLHLLLVQLVSATGRQVELGRLCDTEDFRARQRLRLGQNTLGCWGRLEDVGRLLRLLRFALARGTRARKQHRRRCLRERLAGGQRVELGALQHALANLAGLEHWLR